MTYLFRIEYYVIVVNSDTEEKAQEAALELLHTKFPEEYDFKEALRQMNHDPIVTIGEYGSAIIDHANE